MWLKMICKDAAISYGWQSNFNPFFGFKRLPEGNSYENIQPFNLAEQARIIRTLPVHWKSYFMFAFSSGLRQGEQIALQPDDIDWSRNLLSVRRAFTRDDNGKVMLGETKNRYSRRVIKLTESMLKPLPIVYALSFSLIFDKYWHVVVQFNFIFYYEHVSVNQPIENYRICPSIHPITRSTTNPISSSVSALPFSI
jgi:integrase